MERDPYRRLSARELYRNPWLGVEVHDVVHPSGIPGEHVLIVTPSASAALVEDGEELIFTLQPRFGARREVIEIVKGGREAGEDALACARRELREELGLEAASWLALGKLYEIPSIGGEAISLFIARDLRAVAGEPEAVESIATLRMPARDALAAAIDGRIDDAVTVAALLRYAHLKGWL